MNRNDLKKDRRKRAQFSDEKPTVDRLPPHSIEAEMGALACILIEPERIPDAQEQITSPETFYDLRHQTIWNAAVDVFSKRSDSSDTDFMLAVMERLKSQKRLDDIGGLSYLTSLLDNIPSAANLPHYLEILLQKYQQRRFVITCSEVVARIYDGNGQVDMDAVERDLSQLIESRAQNPVGDSASWNELLEFDTDHDPNCLIGMHNGKTTRWMGRGYGAWLIGPSGVGKSSLALLLAAAMSAGISLWGITPVKPLRTLVIQAENDKGDMAEMVKGVRAGLRLEDFEQTELEQRIAENFKLRSIKGKIGQGFCLWLKREILAHKADLVLVDPLLSFAGIDVSRQDQVSKFLREWFDPILHEAGAAIIAVHHTGKPPRQERGQVPTLTDIAYAGIGSSELVNWARAIAVLQPAGDNQFRLVLAKRGKRAWATHPDGQPTQTLWLRHAERGIFWEQCDPPQESEPEAKSERKEGRPSKQQEIASMNLADFCANCKAEGEGLNEISKRLEAWLAKQRRDVSIKTCKRIIPLLVENGKIAKSPDDGSYRKGPNA